MKKMLLGAVGLSAVLAGCGTDVVVVDPVTNLRVTGYTTQYRLQQDVRDQNGNTIAAGSYVICDDRNTRVGVDVDWNGALDSLAFQFKGALYKEEKTVTLDNLGSPYTQDSRRYEFDLSAGAAPLSLNGGKISAQAIVVDPVTTVDVKGYTYVRVQGYDALGNPSQISESVTQIPVVDCL